MCIHAYTLAIFEIAYFWRCILDFLLAPMQNLASYYKAIWGKKVCNLENCLSVSVSLSLSLSTLSLSLSLSLSVYGVTYALDQTVELVGLVCVDVVRCFWNQQYSCVAVSSDLSHPGSRGAVHPGSSSVQ